MESRVEALLRHFPVVVITGIRQCGKTTLARRIRPDWEYFDLENPADYDRITRDPVFFFEQKKADVLIDEVQQYPELLATLRGVVDADRGRKGRFILTGSSSLELLRGVSESLAGRVGVVELGTLKTNEIFSRPRPRFYEIFSRPIDPSETIAILETLETDLTRDMFEQALLRGGFPEPVLSPDEEFFGLWMGEFFKTYINRDIRALFPRLNAVKYRRFISMLAGLSGTIINRSEVARSVEVSEGTIREYLDIAAGSFVWRNYPSYEKSVSKSVVKMPRGTFTDTGLLNHLLKVESKSALENHPGLGRIYESFVCEEIVKGLHSTLTTSWECNYYRTRNGAEIDLIVDGPFGALPIEIKRGIQVKRRSLTVLRRFLSDNSLPMALILNNADTVEVLDRGIVQVPIKFI
jgi:uncharacterized protein